MVIDMNYWTKVVKKLLILVLSLVALYLSFKLAVFYMPFLVAFIISLLLEPLIRFFMRNCKFKRRTSAIIVLVIVLGIILGLLIWSISTLVLEGSNLLDNLGTYFSNASNLIQNLLASENLEKLNIPSNIILTIEKSVTELLKSLLSLISSVLKNVLSWITSIPTIGLYFVVTVLSLYFICTDKVYMIDQIEHHLPEIWVKKLYKHLKEIISVLGNYLKAEAELVLVSFFISLIGLYIFKFANLPIPYPLLYALGIAFVDALPIFGSGSVMIPWAIISGCNGNIILAVSILALWIIMSVVKQFLEPRIVGNHIGIHPIFTLIAMYTGFRVIGIMGLFIGPIMLIILKNLFGNMVDKGLVKSIFSRDYS